MVKSYTKYILIGLIFIPYTLCGAHTTLRTPDEDLVGHMIKKGISKPYVIALSFYRCKDSDTEKIIRICYALEEIVDQLQEILTTVKNKTRFNPSQLDAFFKDLTLNVQKNHTMLLDILNLFRSKDPSIFKLGTIILPVIPVLNNLDTLLTKSSSLSLPDHVVDAVQEAQKTIKAAQNLAGSNLLGKIFEIKRKLEVVKKNYRVA